MHLVGPDQRHPTRDRSAAERFFKRLNTIIFASQVACFIISFSQLSVSGSRTMKNSFWFDSNYRLQDNVATAIVNCTLETKTEQFGYQPYSIYLDRSIANYIIAKSIGEIRFSMGMNAGAIVVGGLNKLLFDLNIFEIRYRHIILRKELLTVTEAAFIIASFVTVYGLQRRCGLLQSYFDHCGLQGQTTFPYTVPIVAIYVQLVVVLCAHAFSVLILLKHVTDPHPKDLIRKRLRAGEEITSDEGGQGPAWVQSGQVGPFRY